MVQSPDPSHPLSNPFHSLLLLLQVRQKRIKKASRNPHFSAFLRSKRKKTAFIFPANLLGFSSLNWGSGSGCFSCWMA